MKKILKYFKPYLWILLLVLVLKLAAAMLDLMIPSALADILDVAVPSGEMRLIILYGLQMVLFAALEALCNIPANIISSRCVIRTTQKLRQDLFEKISHLSARQMDDVTVSSAVSRLTSDTYNINNMFLRLLRLGLRAPILMIGGLVITALEDPVLALVLVAVMPLVCFVMVFFSMRAVPVHKKKQTILDRMVMVVQENATGIRVIKALSKTEHEKKRYETVNNELADTGLKAGLITTKSGPLINFLFHLGLIAVVLVGALRVNSGIMSSGKIVAFISYFTIIINATIGISSIFVTLSNGMASADRVVQVLDMPDTMREEEIPAEESDYSVEFRNVTFSYNGVEPNLRDISFGLKKGQTLGIIGATGSGKTTLVNLLLRFYDANEGQILLNGQDIRSIENDALRKKFGVALQNDFLVADTIENNIRFYRDLPSNELRRAAALAQAEEFINSKEGGMEYQLEVKANNLSGGQKQRLLIARALASNPEILVLDDSSSALDYATDASLRKALAENFQNTTKVIIAQRVSSIQSADLILVLENGEIIGKGTHEDLLSTCEEYRHIAETQMETGVRKEAAVNG